MLDSNHNISLFKARRRPAADGFRTKGGGLLFSEHILGYPLFCSNPLQNTKVWLVYFIFDASEIRKELLMGALSAE